MPNYNRKGPENKGPMTGRKMGKGNPENKGLTEEEIARKNEKESGGNKGRGSKDGSGKNKGRGRKGFGGRKKGQNRRHRPANPGK